MTRKVLGLVVAAMALGAHAQPAKWADPNKVLRTAIIIAETGFDPQAAQDLYSNTINSAIFDPPYEYDYLARPHKIVPRAAEALPEISADGLTWTIRIKKGVYGICIISGEPIPKARLEFIPWAAERVEEKVAKLGS